MYVIAVIYTFQLPYELVFKRSARSDPTPRNNRTEGVLLQSREEAPHPLPCLAWERRFLTQLETAVGLLSTT